MIRIVVAEVRIHSATNHQTPSRIEYRSHDSRIARAIIEDTNQRLDDASALNFVIVLPDHPMFAGHVQRAKNQFEIFRPVVGG